MASTAGVEGKRPLRFSQFSFENNANLKAEFKKFRAKRLAFDLAHKVKEDEVNSNGLVPSNETRIVIPCGCCCFVGGIIFILDCLRHMFCCLLKQIRDWHYKPRLTYEMDGDSSYSSLDDSEDVERLNFRTPKKQ